MSKTRNVLSQNDAALAIEPLLAQFASLTYEQAASLPTSESCTVQAGRGTADLTIYRDTNDAAVVHVVVQLSVDHGRFLFFFRHGQAFAEGFEFTTSAGVRRLRPGELYDFT